MKRLNLLVVCAALLCANLIAEDYEIKLSRPSQKGHTYVIDGKVTTIEAMEISSQGAVLQSSSDTFIAELKGTVTVQEVNDKGRATLLTITVDSISHRNAESEAPLSVLQKGSTVTVDYRQENDIFLVGKDPAPEQVAKIVDAFYSRPQDISDDDVFGTKDRKKLNDSWEMNKALAVKELKKFGVDIDPEKMNAKVMLKDVKKIGDTPCCLLAVEMSSTGIIPPLPPGLETKESKLEVTMASHFPVDTSLPKRSESGNISFSFLGQGKPNPDGPEMTMKIEMSEKMDATYTPVK